MISSLHHFFHTTPERVEDSPLRIKGFHTLFYPHSLLDKDDLYEIEKWIQIPFLNSFISKDTFLFQQIKGVNYLIFLRVTRLPDAKDTFGRKDGVYQCHGVICPPEVWQKLPSPHSLLTLVESQLFPDRETALASPFVNRETGEISPIEISSESLSWLIASYHNHKLTTFETKLVLLVRRLTIGAFSEGRLLLRGEYQQIVSLVNKSCHYIPSEFWPQLSFDPLLDGLQLHPLPVRIAGYIEAPPKGGNPIIIDLKQESIEGEVDAIFARALDFFEHWFMRNASGAEVNIAELRRMMAVSDFLAKGHTATFPGQLPIDPDFLGLIHGAIDKQFVTLCVEAFGPVTKHVLPSCSFMERFSAVMFGFTEEQFVEFKSNLVVTKHNEPEQKAVVGNSKIFIKRLFEPLFKKDKD